MLWKILSVVFAVVLLGLQFRLWVGQGSLAELSSLRRDKAAQEINNHELSTRNRLLEVEVTDLRSGLDTVEEIAREDLGMIREGETFYLLVED